MENRKYKKRYIYIYIWKSPQICARPLNLSDACIFSLRRKMRKPQITRVPAILNGLTNRPSWKTVSSYANIVKWSSTRPWMISIQVNSKFEWRKWPLKSISTCIWMHSVFRVIRCLKVGTYLSNKGITYLLSLQSSCLSLPKGRRRGSQWDPCEPAPLVDGWLKPMQQFASLVVKGGDGRVLPRFAF